MNLDPVRLLRRVFYLPGAAPRHVDIEISTRCNLHCLMCRRQTVDYGDQLMDFALYRDIVDRLPGEVELLSLGGYGEMLLHPRFFDMVAYASRRGIRTQTTTNGSLLHSPEQIRKLLECGLDRLHVSLDYVRPPSAPAPCGHEFSARVLRNLEHLARARLSHANGLVLGVNCVMHADNFDQLVDLIVYAGNIGLDFVELLPVDDNENRVEVFPDPVREVGFYREVRSRRFDIRVVTPLDRFPAWRRLFYLGRPFCHFRSQTLHIGVKGNVTLCPYGFSRHDFGDIRSSALEAIWHSPDLVRVRRDPFNPVCTDCRIFKREGK